MIKKYKITNLFLILALATSCGIPYTTQPDLIRKINPIISPIPQKIEIKTIKLLPFRKYIETKNGTKFFIDSSTQRIFKINKNGTTTVFAGGGSEKNVSKGQKATDISFDALADMQFFNYEEPNGDNKTGDNVLYVLDSTKNQVLRIDENGNITKVIGSGQKILDNKNTTENNASLNLPTSIALDKKGNVFIADSGNNQIKKVSNDTVLVLDLSTQNQPTKRFFESPVLEIVAGTINLVTTPDSQKAIENKLSNPTAIVIDNNGNIFVSDTENNQIKKIDTNGNISVIAGTTNPSTLPVNTPVKAIDTKLSSPLGLTLDNIGNILFIDSGSNQLKKIDTTGILTNVLNLSKDSNKPVGTVTNPNETTLIDNNNITNITSIDFSPNGSIVINNNIIDNSVLIIDNVATLNTGSKGSTDNIPLLDIVYIPINITTSVPVNTSTPIPTPTSTAISTVNTNPISTTTSHSSNNTFVPFTNGGNQTPVPTPTPTVNPNPTATPVPTPTPTVNPNPTATPVPTPTPTVNPNPTATPVPTPTPTPIPVPTPTQPTNTVNRNVNVNVDIDVDITTN